MTYKYVSTNIHGILTANISSAATLLPLDSATIATLTTEINFALNQWTYLKLDNGVYSEEVKVTGAGGGYAVVTRGTSGTVPKAFSLVDTEVSQSTGSPAVVTDIVAGLVVPSNVTVSGTGQSQVTHVGSNYNVHVEIPTIVGVDGVQVIGAWPLITIGLEEGSCGCCGDGGSGSTPTEGAITSVVIESTILQGEVTAGVLTLGLTEINLTGSDGIEVTGDWPNYNIGLPGGGGGGGGTVLVVSVGTGLSLVGNPNINPTISITNTGVTAGDYAGMVVSATGQITALPVGFAPISVINVDHGTVTRAGIAANIALNLADIGDPGIVALADHTVPLNPADTTHAATPALIAAVLGGTDTYVAGSSTGEADGLYTNAVVAAQITVNVPADKKLLIIGSVTILSDTTPATPIEFGIAVFNTSGTPLWKQKKMTQSEQTILGVINGPLAATIGIATTALTGATVQSSSLAGIVF